MRKNRTNNGYVGVNKLSEQTLGVRATSKSFLDTEDIYDSLENVSDAEYVRPTNGNGYGATATVNLVNGSVTQIYVTNRGTGYTSSPTVTISGGGGSGAQATTLITTDRVSVVSLWHTVSEVIITDKGLGYTSTPTVTFSAPAAGGTTATGTAVIEDGRLVGITVTNAGSRYTGIPTITLSTAGSTKQAVAVPRIVCGTGYTSAPTVSFSGGGGSNAAATAVVTGDLGSFTITAGGSGYTESPTVYLNGTSTDDFIAYATIDSGAVTGITATTTKKFSTPTTVTIGGWKPLPAVSNGEQKIVATFAVYDSDSNFIRFSMSGNYTVDWGDGTSENVNTGVAVQKQYDSASYAAITNQDVFRNYKTVTITITPQAGQNLTAVDFNNRHTSLSSNSNGLNLLDLKIAGNNITSLTLNSLSFGIRWVLIEQIEFIGTLGASLFLGSSYVFQNMYNLQRVIGTQWCTSITNFSNMFSGCFSLKTIPLFKTANGTSFSSMFSNCASVQTMPLLDTSKGTSFSNMFSGCLSLKTIPLLDTAKGTSFFSMFTNCYSLKTIPLLNTASADDFSSMFSNCYSLKTMPLLDTSKGTNFFSMFSACYSLKTIPLLNTSRGTNFSSMFNSCFSLSNIPLLVLTPITGTVTTYSNMFSSCVNLKEIPELSFQQTATTGIFGGIFSSCSSLSRVRATGFNQNIILPNPGQLSADELNEIYTNLPTVSSKTITVTGNWGTAADNPTIATLKGWTVTG